MRETQKLKVVAKNKITINKQSVEEINLNKQAFCLLEQWWSTVRIGYIREIPNDVKQEIERIYRAEIDPNFVANHYCKACYFDCIKRLIKFYKL